MCLKNKTNMFTAEYGEIHFVKRSFLDYVVFEKGKDVVPCHFKACLQQNETFSRVQAAHCSKRAPLTRV